MQISDTRRRFYEAARTMYPNVGEPGTVWVLTQVLGWDMDTVGRISVEGFGRHGYRVFVLDPNGKRVYKDYEARVVSREWTKQEKSKLKDWWWLLGL